MAWRNNPLFIYIIYLVATLNEYTEVNSALLPTQISNEIIEQSIDLALQKVVHTFIDPIRC